MRQELTRGESAVAQTAAMVDKSLEKVDSAFDRMAEAASRSGNILADGFKAAGAAVAGFQVLDAVKNATQLASRYNQLGVVLTTIGQNAGYSSKQQGYEMGLQRFGISAMESRNNLARMTSANLDLAQSAKLARVAQDAAVIGNISSSEAYEPLTFLFVELLQDPAKQCLLKNMHVAGSNSFPGKMPRASSISSTQWNSFPLNFTAPSILLSLSAG
jgi:hypothetical protein